MFDLQCCSFKQMTELGGSLRKLGEGSQSMEEAAGRVVQHLYSHLVSDASHEKQCVLVRLFKTHPYGELDPSLREFSNKMMSGKVASSGMRCLVLLATSGDKPEWNSRQASDGHKAIPLPSEKAIESFPMISRLIFQLGLSASDLLNGDPSLILYMAERSFNIFYVPEAEGSPHVPAQEQFVVPYKVKSVLGFGGLLPSADLFAVIMFSRVHIARETAELFNTLALSVKLALIPFGARVFDNTAVSVGEGHSL